MLRGGDDIDDVQMEDVAEIPEGQSRETLLARGSIDAAESSYDEDDNGCF